MRIFYQICLMGHNQYYTKMLSSSSSMYGLEIVLCHMKFSPKIEKITEYFFFRRVYNLLSSSRKCIHNYNRICRRKSNVVIHGCLYYMYVKHCHRKLNKKTHLSFYTKIMLLLVEKFNQQ